MDIPRTSDISPLCDVVAVRIEYLDAIVLAVANEHSAVVINANVVRQRELTRTLAWQAPRQLELPGSGEPMHAAITVTVRHVYPSI